MAPVRSEARTEIGAGVDAVFGYITDFPRWPEWARGIEECSLADPGQLQAGARIDQRVKASGGATKPRDLDVSAVVGPERIEFTGFEGPSPLRWGFELNPIEGDRTSLLLWVELDRSGPMRAMPAPVVRKFIHDTNARELAIIKNRVEGEVGAVRTT